MTDSTKVWMPDTFFRNEKIGRFHNILQPNLYVRVFPNGDVLYSIRVSLTCACSMHLALFPLDMQTCNLDVASCEFYQYLCTQLIGIILYLMYFTRSAAKHMKESNMPYSRNMLFLKRKGFYVASVTK